MISDHPVPSLILASLILSTPTGAAEPLRHDVFARPTLSALSALTVAAQDSPASNPTTIWNPQLTAIMVAGRKSLATIDGRIVKVGEHADGYQLISVQDSEAVVIKDGQRFTLKMAAPAAILVKSRSGE
jgi:hypothetical protein